MRIAITKLQEKSEGIIELFQRYGHEAVIISTMCAVEPSDPEPLSHLVDKVSKNEIDILIFTSALGVDKLFDKVKPGKNVRIVSVGPKTARKVEEYGMSSEIIEQFSSKHFVEYFNEIKGKTIGIARAEVPNPELTESLKLKNAVIIEAPVYRLKPAGSDFSNIFKYVDAVIFTSARSFEYSGFIKNNTAEIKVIAIGENTANSMKKCGIVPDIVGNGTIESCLDQL